MYQWPRRSGRTHRKLLPNNKSDIKDENWATLFITLSTKISLPQLALGPRDIQLKDIYRTVVAQIFEMVAIL